jgi:drug/metabolite transporter (DMT)-like permease
MAIFVKFAYAQGADTYTLLTLRMLTSTIVMWLYVLFRNPELGRVKMKDLGLLALQGGIGFTFSSVCLYSAMNYIDAGTASILLYTYPTIVSIAAVLIFKERLSWVKVSSLILTFWGCLFVVRLSKLESAGINPVGILYGLGAAIGYSLFSLVGQNTLKRYSSITVSAYSITFSLLTLMIVQPPLYLFKGGVSGAVFMWAFIIAIVSTLLAMTLYLKGIAFVGASRAALISTVEPVFTVILAMIFLNEKLETIQILGGIMILAGVINLQREKFVVDKGRELDKMKKTASWQELK